jgi:hypothetical protein
MTTTYVYCLITHDACRIAHPTSCYANLLHVIMKIISFQICYNCNLTFKYANEIFYSIVFNNCNKWFESAKL